MQQFLLPLLLSTLAGLATVLGGFVTFFVKKDDTKTLSFSLGLAAGVMIFISLFDFLPRSKSIVTSSFGDSFSYFALLMFAFGLLLAGLIDHFLPDHIDTECDDPKCSKKEHYHRTSAIMKKASILTVLAVAIHNLPEGLATFFTSTVDLKLGLAVVLAIALHNIPEGMAIAMPIYQSTGSKSKALLFTLISGLAEPLGGVLGFVFFSSIFHESALGLMFGAIAGIMTYVALDTLLPLAHEYDTGHYAICGASLGMIIIGITLLWV